MAIKNNPSDYRRRLTKSNTNLRFPNQTPSIFTRIVFHEYNRDVSSAVPTHRQVGSIILPIPEDVPDQTNININNVDLGNLRAIIELGSKGIDAVSNITSVEGAADTVKAAVNKFNDLYAGTSVSQKIAMTPGVMDVFTAGRQLAELTGGVVRNPHTTALFTGVALKPYTFSWRLSPRNQEEGETMMSIIKEFKYRALPSYFNDAPTSRFALKYPELVTVSFEGTDALQDVNFAFIENISISNFPNGPSFFKDGRPIEVNISISLRETDIQTKESLE